MRFGGADISATVQSDAARQVCLSPGCRRQFDIAQALIACPACGGLLDVEYDWSRVPVPDSLRWFESRWANRREPLDVSGVWRFRELLPFAPEDRVVTIGEGQTQLRNSTRAAKYAGIDAGRLFLQYEGLNPSGSFKDNGMTAAATHASLVGAQVAACASTGNTSASLAVFGSATGRLRTLVFVGSGKIAHGKLSQALDYGAVTIQIEGDFDDALLQVREVCRQLGIYLCNSVNPFRLEGQKAIMYRVLEGLDWQPPDWVVVPGGNLGNSSAFGKAFCELKELGLIDRIPRLAVINATGANTLYRLVEHHGMRWNNGVVDQGVLAKFFAEMDASGRRADTLATAIEINRPVNLPKCLRALEVTSGVVREVRDEEILDAKAVVGAGGFGCEPASGASLAGARLLRQEGLIAASDRVVCILTGHQLKDPQSTVAYHAGRTGGSSVPPRESRLANRPLVVENNLDRILDVVRTIVAGAC